MIFFCKLYSGAGFSVSYSSLLMLNKRMAWLKIQICSKALKDADFKTFAHSQ